MIQFCLVAVVAFFSLFFYLAAKLNAREHVVAGNHYQ
jgi:hypothetical protein